MSTTYLKAANGQTLDQFFDPYVTGTSPPATGLLNDQGTDIASNVFAPISFGSMATTATGLLTKQAGNADIRTLFAAKGTAQYLIATPSYNGALIVTTGTGSLVVWIQVNPDGTWQSSDGNGGYWYGASPTPGIGSSYQILATVGGGAGAVTNGAAAYTTISSSIRVSVTSSTTSNRSVQLQIKPIGGAAGSSGTFTLSTVNDGSG